MVLLGVVSGLMTQGSLEAAAGLARATGLRVVALSRAVVVVDKPAGLRSVPAYGPGEAMKAAFQARLAGGEEEAALRLEFEKPGRKERWCAVAATQEWLHPKLRARAEFIPRAKTRFVKYATGPTAKMGPAEAAAAFDRLREAVALDEEADGLEESDSVLRRLKRNGFPDASPVHRIDVATSGLLCVAVDGPAAAHLCAQWRDHQVEKRYEALVAGTVASDAGRIQLPLLRRDAPRRSGLASRMVIVDDTSQEKGTLQCDTSFTVLGRFPGYTHVELTPHTGRLHQLRAHCAAIGHPILGDDLYGPSERTNARRLCLHAASLEFVDPETGALAKLDSSITWDPDELLLRVDGATLAALADAHYRQGAATRDAAPRKDASTVLPP